MAANSKSAKFYRDHPDSRRKKQVYDKKLNSRPGQVNKREESNKMRYRAKKRGTNVRGRDWEFAAILLMFTKYTIYDRQMDTLRCPD